MSFLDTLLREIAPKAYANRMRSKALGDALSSGTRSYDAASKSRRTTGWHATGTSINAENRLALNDLRARSRELVRNNPYAKKAIQVLANNVVGAGIRVSPRGKSRGVKVAKELWQQWAETTECDWNGQLNIYGMQAQIMKALARDGEVLIRKRKVGSNRTKTIPIKLQILEADYIASHYEYPYTEGTKGYTIQGIEFSEKGERVKYWLYESHPGDTFRRNIVPKQVPADEILHIYKVERPGQVRGVPEGVSAMLRLRDLDDYEDAQLMKQKVAACFAAFVTNDPNMDNPLGETSTETSERIEPGIIEYLPAGKTVSFASPPSVDGYDEYMKVMLRAIAAGYGVTYEAITGDLSNVNFSSGRMGWLEFHRNITEWQEHVLIPMFCNPVWNWFLDGAAIAMRLKENSGITAGWTPPRREMIDPTKEVKAQIESIQGGIKSWQEVARENGNEPDELLEQLKADREAFDNSGLVLACDYSKNPQVMSADAASKQADQGNSGEDTADQP